MASGDSKSESDGDNTECNGATSPLDVTTLKPGNFSWAPKWKCLKDSFLKFFNTPKKVGPLLTLSKKMKNEGPAGLALCHLLSNMIKFHNNYADGMLYINFVGFVMFYYRLTNILV